MNMRKNSILLLLFAAMTTLTVSCGKDDTDSDGKSGNISGMPTFAELYSYIGRTDIDALKAEFTASGYRVVMEESDLVAEKENIDCYDLKISNGKVTHATYDFEDNTGKTKELLLSKMEEEKKFRSQSGLTQYSGFLYLRNSGETQFSDKDRLISALQNLDLSTIEEGGSHSYYSDVETIFFFGGVHGFSYGLEQR